MIVKLLTEHNLEILSLKGGCTVSSEFTLVKMPHCWNSHAADSNNIRFHVMSHNLKMFVLASTTFKFLPFKYH